ncbi:unnamed protein product [Pylaiella littoralis]
MSARTLLPAADPFACCLVTKSSDALSDSGTLTLKNQHNSVKKRAADSGAPSAVAGAAAGAAGAGAAAPPVAFSTDEFDCFCWPGSDSGESAGDDETRVLNDLLRLGLEFGDLESVFGNTECAEGRSDSLDDEAETRGVVGSEDRVARCAEDYRYLDGGDTKELFLLDGDLQDALLALPDLKLDLLGDEGRNQDQEKDKVGCRFGTSAASDTTTTTIATDGSDSDGTLDNIDCCGTDEIAIGCCNVPFTSVSPAATADLLAPTTTTTAAAAATAPDMEVRQQQQKAVLSLTAAAGAAICTEVTVIDTPLSPTDCCRQNMPGVLGGEDLLVDFNAAATADLAAPATGVRGGVEGLVTSTGSGRGCELSGAEENPGHVFQESAVPADTIAAAPAGAAAAAAAAPASAAASAAASATGVSTRLLDAIDLWESANAYAKKKKKAAAKLAARERAAAAAAAAAEDGVGEDGVAPAPAPASTATWSTTKKISGSITRSNINKKKKNEFGKRRRSSGGGGGTAPVLGDATTTTAAADKNAGKAKGKKGKSKKKVDPLVALKDARGMSRKPLIVQWLKSDGCDSDVEAEAALGKAVGSLSAISRYWGGGG